MFSRPRAQVPRGGSVARRRAPFVASFEDRFAGVGFGAWESGSHSNTVGAFLSSAQYISLPGGPFLLGSVYVQIFPEPATFGTLYELRVGPELGTADLTFNGGKTVFFLQAPPGPFAVDLRKYLEVRNERLVARIANFTPTQESVVSFVTYRRASAPETAANALGGSFVRPG